MMSASFSMMMAIVSAFLVFFGFVLSVFLAGYAVGRNDKSHYRRRLLRALNYRSIADFDEHSLRFVMAHMLNNNNSNNNDGGGGDDDESVTKQKLEEIFRKASAETTSSTAATSYNNNPSRRDGAPRLPVWLRAPLLGETIPWESTKWLNVAMAALWPKVSSSVGREIKQVTNSVLESYRPRSLLKFLGISQCSLGSCPLKITGVRTTSYSSSANDDGAAEPTIELDVIFDNNVEDDNNDNDNDNNNNKGLLVELLAVTTAGITIPVRLRRLHMSGRLVISLEKLSHTLPCFSVLGISFASKPSIDLSLEVIGRVGDVSIIPGLESYMESLITDVVLAPLMVSPKRLLIPILDEAEMKPIGRLDVRVVSCAHLPKMDWFSESDPFVLVSLPSPIAFDETRVCKTEVIMDNPNPKFASPPFTFDVFDLRHELQIEVRDWDRLTRDTLIGTVACSLDCFAHSDNRGAPVSVTLPLVLGGRAGAVAEAVSDRARKEKRSDGKRLRKRNPFIARLNRMFTFRRPPNNNRGAADDPCGEEEDEIVVPTPTTPTRGRRSKVASVTLEVTFRPNLFSHNTRITDDESLREALASMACEQIDGDEDRSSSDDTYRSL